MSDTKSERMVGVVEKLLTALIWLNWICAIAFAVVLVVSFVVADQLLASRTQAITSHDLSLMRMVLVLAMFVVPLAHIALTRLRAIVATVRVGDPFVPANARRLTAIAWALLGIMIIDLLFGVLTNIADHSPGWSFSLTGWLAVLLLFVLARVFDHGARLRDDVEGTV